MKSAIKIFRKGKQVSGQLFVVSLLLILPAMAFGQFVKFSDVSQSAGVSEPDSGTGHGVVFADFNGDGLLDIYMVNWWNQPNFLFINNGNGTFTNRASDFGVTVPDGGDRGVSAADFDNDGDMDLYVSAGGANWFFRNDNNQHFADITYSSGAADWGQGMNVCFGDYDRDGNVDLLITNQGTGWNELFHNNGNGSFSKVTSGAGLGSYRYSSGAAFFDYDNDGYLDIIIIRGNRDQNYSNLLYHNNGNGTFTEMGSAAGVATPGDGIGVAIGDYNNDGYLDIYITEEWQPNRLYRNNGNGTFTNVASQAGVADNGRNVGCTFGDFNNDGYLDIYETTYGGSNRLYRNNGNGTFSEVGSFAGVNDWGNGFGVTIGDYNRDGQVDIFLSNAGQRAKLFKNNGSGNHWLALRLIGESSNRSAIGARVTAFANGKRQIREICGGSSYVSENSLEVYFGLGSASVVDSLIINWPSGIRQRFYNLATNQYMAINEYQSTTPPPVSDPQLHVDFSELDFGYTQTSAHFHISNAGQQDLQWQIADNGNEAWLTDVNPLSGENDATITVQIDRSGLAPGVYEEPLVISSNGGQDTVRVVVKVKDAEKFNLKMVAGGTNFIDSEGETWQADRAYSDGDWGYIGGKTYSNGNEIQNTHDPYLYQTERYGMSAYQFNVPNGKYAVILHFAEIFWNQNNRRLFNVSIEDSLILDHYDIYSEVGKNFAVRYVYIVNVQDGILNIDFTTLVDNAKISAIELIQMNTEPSEPQPILSSSVDSLNFSSDKADTTFIIQNVGEGNLSWHVQPGSLPAWILVAPDSGGNYDTVSVHIQRAGLPPNRYSTTLVIVSNGGDKEIPVSFEVQGNWLSVYRINVGGEAYQDQSGQIWAADQAYSEGNWGYVGGHTYGKDISISGTTDDALFQSERYNLQEYRFDLPNGYYRIKLYFAEIYWKNPNKRIFNLSIENNTVLNHYDIFADVGYAVATQKTFIFPVVDNQLNISFENVVDYGKLSALEIDELADSLDQPILSVSPHTLDFGKSLDSAYLCIQNIANGTLNWQIELNPDTVSWISGISKLSGVNDDSVLFTVDRSAVQPGSYQTQFRVTSNGGTEMVTLQLQVVDTTNYHIYVNAGADSAYLDTSGNLWYGDQAFVPGSWGFVGGTPYFKDVSIQNTEDDDLYKTERYGDFSYIFTVPNGTYNVVLYFAEIFWHDPGKRIFSVKINGQQVMTDFDIMANVGFATATQKIFTSAAETGQIKVDFITSVDNAKISAIELWKTNGVARSQGKALPLAALQPCTTRLVGNYPNPFNPETQILFELASPSRVKLEIYNILGEKIRTLIDEEEMETGSHIVFWNATNSFGTSVPSGVYFCRMVANPVSNKGKRIEKTLKILYAR